MRNLRVMAIVFVLLFSSFLLSGCGKTWSFNFLTATQEQLDDWYVDDWGGDLSYTDDGADMDFMGIASPVSFDGDWTMEVVFELATDELDQVYFEIYPGDGQGWEPDNYIWTYFDYVGWNDEEEWYVDETGESSYNIIVDESEGGDIPGLKRNDENTWKLVKRGSNFTLTMNGTFVASFFATECDTSEDFYLNLYAELYGGSIYFKSVKVTYSGNMFEL